jgi:uncharacterized YigZ family protein
VAFVYLAKALVDEQVISKSRFITALFPVADAEAAKSHIAAVRKAHYSARHHATAMVIGPTGGLQRSSDDGEPAGTAGVPMLEVLRRREVTDTLAVVTRYFGGVLLGAGGLVRAYSGGVAAALDQAAFTRKEQRGIVHLSVPAGEAGRVEGRVRAFAATTQGVTLEAVDYAERATFELAVTGPARAALDRAIASGLIRARLTDRGVRLITI